MNSWKKVAVGSLAASMMLVTACGNSGKSNNSGADPAATAAQTDTKATYEVVMGYPALGEVPKDIGAVQEAISKITKEKINATVKLMAIPFGQWVQQSNLMLASGEKLDVMLTDFKVYGGMVASKQLASLDDLIAQHGQGIKEALKDKLEVSRIDGKMYAVPVNQFAQGGTQLSLRKDILDKIGVDVNNIKSIDDLEGVFATVKKADPNVSPLAVNPQGNMPLTAMFAELEQFDSLLDSLGVLNNAADDMKVINLYETPEYAAVLKKLRSWYVAGYIPSDAASIKTSNIDQVKSGKAFSLFGSDQPGAEIMHTASIGKEMVRLSFPLQKPLSTTQTVLGLMWAIPANNTKDPVKAMEFLNLLYTDKDIVNLLDYGIEGKHYTKKADNIIARTNGTGYDANQAFMFGNVHLRYLTELENPKLLEEGKVFEKTIISSKARGYVPNLDPVKTEVTAVNNVTAQYVAALETGSVDPDKVLPQFIEKLKVAGIDKIIAEKQKQLDAWAAANK